MAEMAHCPAEHKQNTIKQSALVSALPYTRCLIVNNYTFIATADVVNIRGFQDQTRPAWS